MTDVNCDLLIIISFRSTPLPSRAVRLSTLMEGGLGTARYTPHESLRGLVRAIILVSGELDLFWTHRAQHCGGVCISPTRDAVPSLGLPTLERRL